MVKICNNCINKDECTGNKKEYHYQIKTYDCWQPDGDAKREQSMERRSCIGNYIEAPWGGWQMKPY